MRNCPPLLCPVCTAPLAEAQQAYRCANGHSYDRSRHGYVDLLPHGHGRSNRTGDTRAMIAARERFLDAGHYAPLRDAVVRLVTRHRSMDRDEAGSASSDPVRGPVVLESGCGDGWYLSGVTAALGAGTCGFGFDISPWALRAAARRCRDCTLFLNDVSHRICLPDASVDFVLDIFAPRNAAEFRRVLRPDGVLLVVIPGAAHLRELGGELAIGAAPDKRSATLSALQSHFELHHVEMLEYSMALNAAALTDLLGMTPSAHHARSEADPVPAGGAGARTVTASFELLVLNPAGSSAE
jgi:23S rRNA (guanine745-N1)-methyltransferase